MITLPTQLPLLAVAEPPFVRAKLRQKCKFAALKIRLPDSDVKVEGKEF